MNKEKMKQEAVDRMKKIGIYDETIKQFDKQNLISESAPPLGACYWLNDEQRARVKTFEDRYNTLVYHVIHSYTEFGELETYLFVSDNEEEWQFDREGLKQNMCFSYVQNISNPDFSEFGSIGFELTPAAGVKRVW